LGGIGAVRSEVLLKRSELWLGPEQAGGAVASGLVDRVLEAWEVSPAAADHARAKLAHRLHKVLRGVAPAGWVLHVSFAISDLGADDLCIRAEVVCCPDNVGPGI
jgi:hypothetical protein